MLKILKRVTIFYLSVTCYASIYDSICSIQHAENIHFWDVQCSRAPHPHPEKCMYALYLKFKIKRDALVVDMCVWLVI